MVELSLKCQFSLRWFQSVTQPIEAKMKAFFFFQGLMERGDVYNDR